MNPRHPDYQFLRHVRTNADRDGFLAVPYHYSQGTWFGRAFTSVGFQRVTKATRYMCSGKYYVEDDMVNSFPTILAQILHAIGQRTPVLDRYVSHREEVFAEIAASNPMPRAEMKKLFLASLHQGNYQNHTRGAFIPFLHHFSTELKRCSSVLLKRPEFKELVALAQTKKQSFAVGTLVGWVCQTSSQDRVQ